MNTELRRQLMTGIAGIDRQHNAFINWARSILVVDGAEPHPGTVLRADQFLIAYTRYHFDSGEYAMVGSCHEALDDHRREHAEIRKQLSEVSRSIQSGGADHVVTVKSLQRLIGRWLQNHIGKTDFAFARYCEREPSARAVMLPSPRELLAAGKKVSDYDNVEFVHLAGEMTPEEIRKRLGVD